jgi:hypothetical protein
MGYTTAADLGEGYPRFFWEVVTALITEGIRLFRRTQEGQKWLANLYANVFTIEHEAPAYGPERRDTVDRRDQTVDAFKAKEIRENDKRVADRRNAGIVTLCSRSENSRSEN